MVFVDTSAWFAYFLPTDSDHQRVRNCFLTGDEQLVTSDYCIDETLTLLMARGELRRASEAGLAFFEAGVVQVHFVTPGQISRAWILFKQHAAAGWSFTDCTSKVVIDDLGIATAIALDSHFHQFGIAVVP
jgi:predicted nucleic acid-binding protein